MHLVKCINYIKTIPILCHVEHLEFYHFKNFVHTTVVCSYIGYKNKSLSSVRTLNSLLPNMESKVPDLSSRTWLVRTGLFLLSGCFVVWIIPMSSISLTLHVNSSSRVAVRMDGDIWGFLFHFLNRGLVKWLCSRVRGDEVKECNAAVGLVVSAQDVHLFLRLEPWQLVGLWFILIYGFTSTLNKWIASVS